MSTTRPPIEEQTRLYLRLLERDPVATSAFIEAFMPSLLAALQAAFTNMSTLDADIVDNCVMDTLLRFPEQPEKYQPGRGALWTYLYVDAKRDVLNEIDRVNRQRRREQDALRIVALDEQTRNEQWQEQAFASALESEADRYLPDGVSLDKVRAEITSILSHATDQVIVQLLVAGVRETERYADVMGITHLPVIEQRKQVKQAKDRLKKRLNRLGAKINDT
jgi:RNA polymerase sigma-70 factor (ECF subfamily)